MAGDAYFGLVSSSLHGNGANNGTVITDSAFSPKTWTRDAGGGYVETRTAQKKFGTASLYFESTGGTVVLTSDPSANWEFTGDLTIDGWFYCLAPDIRVIFRILDVSDGSKGFYLRLNGTDLELCDDVSGVLITIASSLNAWHHFEFSRSGSTCKLAHDGTFSGTTVTRSGTIFSNTAGNKMYIGSRVSSPHHWYGYLDDIRFTEGVARHTANFSVPTAENADYSDAPVEATLIPMTGEITCFGQEPITIEMVASPLTGSVTVEPSPIEMTLDGVAIEEMTSEFEALVGTSTPMAGELPSVEGSFLLDSANIDGVLAPLTSQIDALNGSIGSLDATMTTLDGDFAGDAWQQATIDIRLTRASASFVGLVGTYATVQGTLPRMKGVLTGSVGNTADIDIDLPELDADITAAMGGFPTINMLMREMRGELR